MGPEPLAYDVPGTDQGNQWKITKVCCLEKFALGCWLCASWLRGWATPDYRITKADLYPITPDPRVLR